MRMSINLAKENYWLFLKNNHYKFKEGLDPLDPLWVYCIYLQGTNSTTQIGNLLVTRKQRQLLRTEAPLQH
jgi:hypothetical protein